MRHTMLTVPTDIFQGRTTVTEVHLSLSFVLDEEPSQETMDEIAESLFEMSCVDRILVSPDIAEDGKFMISGTVTWLPSEHPTKDEIRTKFGEVVGVLNRHLFGPAVCSCCGGEVSPKNRRRIDNEPHCEECFDQALVDAKFDFNEAIQSEE